MNPDRLILDPSLLPHAYANGYFPMPDPDTGDIMWLRPDPRAILPLAGFHCSRSLARALKKPRFTTTFDQAFKKVMEGCSEREDTWITPDFFSAYQQLHLQGFAHSVEVWEGDQLAGGLYGVSLGGAFFAESKFHRADNASKVALFRLVEHLNQRNYHLLEVQFLSTHLESLGVVEVSDNMYQLMLREALRADTQF